MNIKVSIVLQKIISLPLSLLFNLYYLPFNQAIKIPILIHKPKFIRLRGKIILNTNNIRFGMIQIGFWGNALYTSRQQGVNWENHGGTVCFNGSANFGIGTCISIGKNAQLEFGDDFLSGPMVKFGCYKKIVFGTRVRIGWESIILDTDFHQTINRITGIKSEIYKEIKIGSCNWIGIRSIILKGSETRDFCIVGANSMLNKKYDFPEYSLVAGNPVKLKAENVYRDFDSYIEI